MRSTRSTSAAAVANHAVAARVVTRALGEPAAALGLLGFRPSAPLAASESASDVFAEWRLGAAGDVIPHPYPLYGDLNLQASVLRTGRRQEDRATGRDSAQFLPLLRFT